VVKEKREMPFQAAKYLRRCLKSRPKRAHLTGTRASNSLKKGYLTKEKRDRAFQRGGKVANGRLKKGREKTANAQRRKERGGLPMVKGSKAAGHSALGASTLEKGSTRGQKTANYPAKGSDRLHDEDWG